MEPVGSLPHSQETETSPYPEPDQSSPAPPPIPLPKDPSSYYPLTYASVFQVVFFAQVSSPKPCFHLSSIIHLLQAAPISLFLIEHLDNITWRIQIIKLLIM